ncbi:DUF2251 domain-containing protein [Bisgaard Taxon 10/6]|uniref:DUF2251 domain-containing protein n=1 Tax=Exercitatus varius TaxID=67857 RepID=UPI00294B57EA|nr:DUF2251 domain-containing protein [Exercitatus varius]MDG2955718.1 DUF2251 domain-containing protein [Exercitatus varius]MDG2961456.1 DUF2251 domain-containing protein [Exercitatus varius]MDG2963998.1 DUF2251 domain-containing protein [Exercitatus varius]
MLHLVLEDKHLIGRAKRFGAHSVKHDHLVVMFEDDGETGYFYALNTEEPQPVVDSLFVYGCHDIEGKHEPRTFQICWTEDGMQAFLLVNGYPHASFDFARLVGFNHSKYPEPDLGSMWSRDEINDDLVKKWLNE